MLIVHPYILLLLLSGVGLLVLAVYCYVHRAAPGAGSLAGLLIGTAVYTLAYAAELGSESLSAALVWRQVGYAGIVAIPIFWILFTTTYSRMESRWRLSPARAASVLSLLTMLAILTNPLHGLFSPKLMFEQVDGLSYFGGRPGPFYWLFIGYLNMAMLYGVTVILAHLPGRSRDQRIQDLAVLAAGLLPWLTHLVHLLGVVPLLDLVPFSFVLSDIVLFLAIFRLRLLNIYPIAYRAIFLHMPDGALVLDCNDELLDWNAAAEAVFPELGDRRRQTSRNKQDLFAQLQNRYPELSRQAAGEELKLKLALHGRPEGSLYRVRSMYFTSRHYGQRCGRVILLTDITEREQLLHSLHELATHDDLTGLSNRRLFFTMAEHEFKRARRYHTPISLLMFDIDHFKEINDTCGHHAGDEVLRQLAGCCLRSIRDSELFARVGGEEFAVLLPDTSLEQAHAAAERLRESLAAMRTDYQGHSLAVTASFGVAGLDRVTLQNCDDLLRIADSALYRAKDRGRNCTAT